MAMQAYNAGLDQFQDWETDTYEWLMVTGGDFDITAATVGNVLAECPEVTVTGYARLPVTGAARTLNNALNRISYAADDPQWTGLAGGESVAALVLCRLVTDDSDSVPIGWWPHVPAVPTDSADPLIFEVAGGVTAYVDQVTP